MSVIIRLQNLPWSANALDIRQFFHGLSIPEGGVHIVGGELGDAFIAFSTDEDARQAYLRNNGKIKEVQISLMLSSRTEMQKVIEAARAQSYAAFMKSAPAAAPPVVPLPAVVPPIVPTAVPEIKRDTKEKEKLDRKDRRRSRSKSRDRRDRSRDRDRKDRRYRDRSRSRSRDRKSRNRRGRSRSKGRSHSNERDRRSHDRRKRSEERLNPPFQKDRKQSIDRWANVNKKVDNNKPSNVNSGGPPIIVLDDPKPSHNNPNGTPQEQMNGFNPSNFQNDNSNSSENWQSKKMNNFGGNNRFNENFQQNEGAFPNRFRNFGGRYRGDINPKQGCVAVEPFYGGYSDIRRFFNGLFISNRGIKFINDENGRKTGLVLVQFGGSTARCVEQALSLNGENLNGINVSVTLINEDEFDAAVDRYVPSGNNPGSYEVPKFKNRNVTKPFNSKPNPEQETIEKYTCLIVDELPNYCKEQDILHMFSQHPLVALILTSKKRGGHIAYVKFSSPDVAQKALEEKSLHFVSGKPVMVKPCKDDEFEEINKEHDVQMDTKDTKLEEEVKTDCISISQLPLKTIDKDIADFFSDVGVIPTKIHLMSNDLGFTGQAYCEFMSAADCSKAVKKNGTVLGPNTIKVVPVDRAEMLSILGQTIPGPEPLGKQETARAMLSPNPFHPVNSFNSRMPNRPPFFNRFEGPTRGAMRFGPRGGNAGPPRQRFQQPQVDNEGPPGCTIFLNNVPYKAGTAEILNLFEGFNHTHNVSRRYNTNNKPSDEAKITFYDPEEATRAVHALNKAKIWDRMIFLRQE